MSFVSSAVLAWSMSADAFAVSVGKGVALKKPSLRDAARTGLIFGGTEALAPIVGWLAGSLASVFILTYDHWVAFIILAMIGLRMIWQGYKNEACEVEVHTPQNQKLYVVFLTAVGTSIDSMAVGVSLAFVDMNIWIMAAAIGFATFTMSTLGIMIGHFIGCRIGRVAEILGGAGLIAIGTKILCTHLELI